MNALITFLFMLPFLLPIVLANFAERERSVRILLFVYLGRLGGLVRARICATTFPISNLFRPYKHRRF